MLMTRPASCISLARAAKVPGGTPRWRLFFSFFFFFFTELPATHLLDAIAGNKTLLAAFTGRTTVREATTPVLGRVTSTPRCARERYIVPRLVSPQSRQIYSADQSHERE